MIITDPALIALQSTVANLSGQASAASRWRFWSRRSSRPTVTDERAARAMFSADVDFAAHSSVKLESGGLTLHASTRRPIDAR
jgi:hypothetical protein